MCLSYKGRTPVSLWDIGSSLQITKFLNVQIYASFCHISHIRPKFYLQLALYWKYCQGDGGRTYASCSHAHVEFEKRIILRETFLFYLHSLLAAA
jgi:hypothetical protein